MVIQLKKTVADWQEIALRLSNYFRVKGYTEKSNIHLFREATCEELLVLDLLRALYLKLQNNAFSAKPKAVLSMSLTMAESVSLIAISSRPLTADKADPYTAACLRMLTAEIDQAVMSIPPAPAGSMIPTPTLLLSE